MRKTILITSLVLMLCAVFVVDLGAETRQQSGLSYLKLGDDFARHHDFVRAIGAYTIAVQFAPDFAPAFFHRARAYEACGEVSKAIADYSRALDLAPDMKTALYNRGNLHLGEGDLDSALADFDQALARDPRYVMAYNNRGVAKIAKGDVEGAL